MCEASANSSSEPSVDYYVEDGPKDGHINRTSIAKDRKRISDPGGPIKDRSKAKGIGQRRSKG